MSETNQAGTQELTKTERMMESRWKFWQAVYLRVCERDGKFWAKEAADDALAEFDKRFPPTSEI